jgi:hypothetical protein
VGILSVLNYAVLGMAAFLAGLTFSFILWYMILRFAFKDHTPMTTLFRLFWSKRVHGRTEPSEAKFTEVIAANEQRALDKTFTEPFITDIDEKYLGIVSELLMEIKYNTKVAREFAGENLVSLKTDIWDTRQYAISFFPEEFQKQLKNAYHTTKLLNELVWFSTEFQRRSPALNEQYESLLNIVSRQLSEITNLLFLDFTRTPLRAVTTKIEREIKMLKGSF